MSWLRFVFPLGGLVFAIALSSCDQNPFGTTRDAYAGTNQILALGQGFHFDVASRVAVADRETDFYFYQRNLDLYLGVGWDTGPGGPTTQCIAQIDKTIDRFDEIKFAPAYNNGNYKGQILITPSSLSNQALFSVYTRDGRFALIGVTALETNGAGWRIRFRYVYNPASDGTFNLSYYETR